jgi:two-component system sensor histidine kinase YesM
MEQVNTIQESVLTYIDTQTKNEELLYSKLINGNDGRVLELADDYFNTENDSEQFKIINTIDEYSSYMNHFVINLDGIVFHSTDDDKFYLHTDFEESDEPLIIPESTDSQNTILKTFLFKTTDSYKYTSSSNKIPIAIAYKNSDFVKYPNLDVIMYYKLLSIPSFLYQSDSYVSKGNTYLISNDNDILYESFSIDLGNILSSIDQTKQSGTITIAGKKYSYFIKKSSLTNLKMINIMDNDELLSKFKTILNIILCIMLVILFFIIIYMRILFLNVINPIKSLSVDMQKTAKGDWTTPVEATGYTEIQQLALTFNYLKVQIKKAQDNQKNQLLKLHEAEMHSLQTQINPHFMVNCLESLKAMANLANYYSMANMSEAMITIVSASFRSNLSNYTLNTEIDVLKSYVLVSKLRSVEDFEVTFDIDESLLNLIIPRLMLQHLLDNAINHAPNGIDTLYVNIIVKRNRDKAHFEISDNGQGMSEEQVKILMNKDCLTDASSIGISNIRQRLAIRYLGKAEFNIFSEEGKGTKIVIDIPIDKNYDLIQS